MLQVLVDADNVHRSRLVALFPVLPADARVVAAGRPAALRSVPWPEGALLLDRTGWQQADLDLAAHYRPDDGPLVLVTGDGDFAHLGQRHGGPVLVISDAPSTRLREIGTVLDPVHDGTAAVADWVSAVTRLD